MRYPLMIASLVVLAACATGESDDGASSTAPTTPATTGAPTTSTTPPTSAAPLSTTTSTASSSTTTAPPPGIPEAVCAAYADYVQASSEFDETQSLRNLSIAVGFPRDPGLTDALEVLRGRSSGRPEAGARAAVDQAFGPCAVVPGRGEAGFDGLFEAGILVGGPNGVGLLDGTPVIAPDPVGTYVAAFDDWNGGVFSLLEIRGLEVIDHRSGTAEVPRDLVLAEDARLHDAARIGGVDVGIVTI